MNNLAPIVLFVYNRLDHTKQTVEALKANTLASQSDLYIFSDAPKSYKQEENVKNVRKYLKSINGFKSVTIEERSINWGIEDSVVFSVSEICRTEGKVIVLEDDIVTSPFFLEFMNNALNFYKNIKDVSFISGYNHPGNILSLPESYNNDVYFVNRNCSYGWATWIDRFEKIQWDLDLDVIKNDKKIISKLKSSGDDVIEMLFSHLESKDPAWDIRITYHQCKHNLKTLYPRFSYVNNIGFDDTGLHCESTDRFHNDLSQSLEHYTFIENTDINKKILKNYKNVYKYSIKSNLRKFMDNIFRKAGYKLVKL